MLAVQMVHRADLIQHVLAQGQAVFDGIGLYQVEQNLLQIVILLLCLYAAQFVRIVLTL